MRPTRWTSPSNLIILLSFSGIVSINNRKNHYFSVAEKLKTQQGRDLQGRETELHIQVLAFSRGPICYWLNQAAFTCSKWIIETLEHGHWSRSGDFIVNFKHISHLALVFLLLTFNI